MASWGSAAARRGRSVVVVMSAAGLAVFGVVALAARGAERGVGRGAGRGVGFAIGVPASSPGTGVATATYLLSL